MTVRRPAALLALALATASLAPAALAQADVAPFTFSNAPVAAASSFTEPSLSYSPDGLTTTVSAPGAGGVAYWVSKDDGATFTRQTTTGGGGDSELDYQPDGTLLSADLAITNSVIQRSTDGGLTWTEVAPAGEEQDRQWLAHLRSERQYLVYHGIAEELVKVVASTDQGTTWGPERLVNSPDQFAGIPNPAAGPGDTASLVDQGYNTFQGPMLVDQTTGDSYVIYSISSAQDNATSVGGFGPTRGIVVAHTADPLASTTGENWTNRYAVVSDGVPAVGTVNGAIFPWGTIGPDGTVYVLFNSTSDSGSFGTYYVYSTGPAGDRTSSWSAPVRVDGLPSGTGATVYVTGEAGAPGVLDVAWFQTDNATSPDDTAAVWHVDFAQVRDAASASPQITRARVSDHVIHNGTICQKGILCVGALGDDRSLGDFFELAINPVTGMAGVAWSDNGNPQKTKRVYYAAQTSGLSALVPTPADPVVPEAPVAVLLPLAAAAALAGAVSWRRRRAVA